MRGKNFARSSLSWIVDFKGYDLPNDSTPHIQQSFLLSHLINDVE